MKIQTIIAETRELLISTFSSLDTWFDKGAELRCYRPSDRGWTINEILEHIVLTNHFLLILIHKGTTKALANIHQLDLEAELQSFEFHYAKLAEIGMHKSFEWIRPIHMEPTGKKAVQEIRTDLKQQLDQSLSNLDKLKNGEGVLYKTTMSVNALGKINVYEYMYFLAQHGQRHISQMQKNEAAYEASKRAANHLPT